MHRPLSARFVCVTGRETDLQAISDVASTTCSVRSVYGFSRLCTTIVNTFGSRKLHRCRYNRFTCQSNVVKLAIDGIKILDWASTVLIKHLRPEHSIGAACPWAHGPHAAGRQLIYIQFCVCRLHS